ncbi:MAG: UbiD family decarboxylase, partial [Xanthobacteraceae bacterium]
MADVDRFRLRRFVEALGDDLETVSGPTDLADVAAVLEGNPKAVLFRAVGPERQELVGNVTGSRARIARAFGVEPNELLPELLRRLRS